MFTPELESWIRKAIEEVSEGSIDPEVDENGGLRVGFLVPVDEEGEEQSFWVTFTQNAPDYFGDNPPADLEIQQYLVISWWIPTEEFGSIDPRSDALIYRELDSFNQEPGVKCRIDLDDGGVQANDFIVFEADVPISSIDRYGVVVLAIDRLVEFVVNNFPVIRDQLELHSE